MKTRHLFAAAAAAAVLAGAALTTLPASASDRVRQQEVRQLRESGKILPMEDILGRARAAQPGQVVEVELERESGRYVYEVKVIDDADKVHKLELDAGSGELLRRKTR
ncbi:MAG: PepSY domain-containing protein [Burkholderiaceae bacterium]|nr:PepSY domain-containing protein [Burkholderiaceae bacterium]